MNEEIIKNESDIAEVKHENRKKDSPRIVLLREILAGILWVFLFIKIFIYDIDNLIIEQIDPDFVFILKYKFFIILGICAIFWISLGNKNFAKLLSVIIFFPFILLFWRIPKLFWKSKSWIGVFASIGIVLTFFNSIKVNFFVFTILAFSIVFISSSSNTFLLTTSTILLFIYLFNLSLY